MERRFRVARSAANRALSAMVRAKLYADPGDGTMDRAITLVREYLKSLPKDFLSKEPHEEDRAT